MNISNSEKLILFMLASIHKHLNIDDGIDPDFVHDVICKDFAWALPWKYNGIFRDSADETPGVVSEVCDILEMWEFIEHAYENCNKSCQKRIRDAYGGEEIKFFGFDGNAGNNHIHIARFLINEMEYCQCFKGRDIDSHTDLTTRRHRRMLPVYREIRRSNKSVMPTYLSVDQVIEIIAATNEHS